MAHSPMKQVELQAGLVWSSRPNFAFDETDSRYTRENIRLWLLNWHEFNQLGSYSLGWARARADMELAVAALPDALRDFFEIYCVLGYSQDEVHLIFDWRSSRTFSRTWSKLLRRVYAQLHDRVIRQVTRDLQPLILPPIGIVEDPWPVRP